MADRTPFNQLRSFEQVASNPAIPPSSGQVKSEPTTPPRDAKDEFLDQDEIKSEEQKQS